MDTGFGYLLVMFGGGIGFALGYAVGAVGMFVSCYLTDNEEQ